MSADLIAAKLTRAGYSLLALICALVSAGFLTAGGWIILAEQHGAGMASVLVGVVYIALAVIVVLIRPRALPEEGPDRVSVGLALGSSFLQGFTAGQQVRR
jgi:TRAP-type C4-dicarboxylate transport system permease small subunit